MKNISWIFSFLFMRDLMYRISKIKHSNGFEATKNSTICKKTKDQLCLVINSIITGHRLNQIKLIIKQYVIFMRKLLAYQLKAGMFHNQISSFIAHFVRRFLSVKRRFMLELNNLRKEPASPSVNANIISLNTGMRFFRVKVKFLK